MYKVNLARIQMYVQTHTCAHAQSSPSLHSSLTLHLLHDFGGTSKINRLMHCLSARYYNACSTPWLFCDSQIPSNAVSLFYFLFSIPYSSYRLTSFYSTLAGCLEVMGSVFFPPSVIHRSSGDFFHLGNSCFTVFSCMDFSKFVSGKALALPE